MVPLEVDMVARGIAVFGAFIAAASLLWQVVQFRLSGVRVKVDARWGRDSLGIAFDDYHDEDWPALVETVRNVGRVPVDITTVTAVTRGRRSRDLIRAKWPNSGACTHTSPARSRWGHLWIST